jgi:hypothetical protein
MTRDAAEITRNARGQRRRSVPDRENVPPRPTDAGFDAVRKASQGLGTPEIRLKKRPKPGRVVISLAAVVSEQSSGKCR